MTSKNEKTIACVLLAGLLAAFITGCACCLKKPCTGPIFLTHPEGQIVMKGSTVTLSVDAKNPKPYEADPVEYQWYFDYAPIKGENGKTLTLKNVQPGSAGRYFAIASGYGATKSCDADVMVNTPPPFGIPTGNGGSLTVGISSFYGGNGGQTCFPNPPWDKYRPIIGYFLAPNYPPPLPTPNFPNVENQPTVTIKTCNDSNANSTVGTTLQTGIVIVNDANPNGDKVCATNNCSATNFLTIDIRSLTPGNNKYRATVFYKSGTKPAGLTNVTVDWHYP